MPDLRPLLSSSVVLVFMRRPRYHDRYDVLAFLGSSIGERYVLESEILAGDRSFAAQFFALEQESYRNFHAVL